MYISISDICKVQIDGKYGLYNSQGIEIVPCEYDNISQVQDMFFIRKGELLGVVNSHGRVIVPCEFVKILCHVKNGKEYFRVKNSKGKYGCIDRYGHVVIPIIHDDWKIVYNKIGGVAVC